MPPSSATAYQSLTAFKPRSSQDVMGEAEKKYDLEGSRTRLSSLRGLVGNLRSSVEAVDPSVTGRTSGTFTTEGQRQALVSKERAPILNDLSEQQGALGEEQQNFNTSQGLATQMASALMNEDHTTYQRLLDQYNAATAAEAAAEQKRQAEAAMAEQRRQFDAQQQAAARAAKSSNGYAINLGGGGGGKTTSTPAAASPADLAYQSVQKFLKGDNRSILSDYNATLNSANRGNAMDKIKVQLYRQARPDLFTPGLSPVGGSGISGNVGNVRFL